MKRTKLIALWLAAMSLLLVLTACNDGSATPGVPAATPTNVPATTAPATATPAQPTSVATSTVTANPSTQAATATPAITTSVATPTPVATTPAATAQPTAVYNPYANNPPYVVYLKDSTLFAYKLATRENFELAKGKTVLRYLLSLDSSKVAFLLENTDHLELALVSLDKDKPGAPVILDKQVGPVIRATQDNPFAGISARAFTLDFSNDGNLLAFTKTNPAGPSFESWGSQVKPTEVWLSRLQPGQNQRLVANNEKNFMYKVAFSPDRTRIGFIRTAHFSTDVSGTAAVWSVHTDGTKLSLLQEGSKLVKSLNPVPENADEISLITDLRWTSDITVAFVVESSAGGALWLHDLSNAKARLLIDSQKGKNPILYDPLTHLYAYADDSGVYTVAGGGGLPTEVRPGRVDLLGFTDGFIMFKTADGKVVGQHVDVNGTPDESIILQAPYRPTSTILFALVGEAGLLVSWTDDPRSGKAKLTVFDDDVKPITPQPLEVISGKIYSLNLNLGLIVGYGQGLQLLDLRSGKPVVQTIATGNIYWNGRE